MKRVKHTLRGSSFIPKFLWVLREQVVETYRWDGSGPGYEDESIFME
jgi:hypothetical protein